MRKLLVVGVAMVMATSVMAQGLGGVPIASEAAPVEPATVVVNAGATLYTQDGMDFGLGVRGTYGAIENLTVFGDLGMVNMDFFDMVLGLAVGAQYSFSSMVELPVDLAARATYNYLSADKNGVKMDMSGISLLGVVSAKIEQVDGLAVYGGLGYWLAMGKVTVAGLGEADVDSEFVAALGATYGLPVENLSMYAEVDLVDDAMISIGAAYTF